jgi:hypothetical protein
VVKLLLVVVQPGVTGIRLPIAVVIMAKLSGKTDGNVGWLTGGGAGFPWAPIRWRSPVNDTQDTPGMSKMRR